MTTLIRAAKKTYYAEKLENCKHDAKQTWNILNSVLGRQNRSNLPSSININNSSNSDPRTISDYFNSYFINIGPNLANKIMRPGVTFQDFLNHIKSPASSFFLSPTDKDEILSICKLLKSGTSSGFDDIKTDIIKAVADHVAFPLTHIFNLSLSTGVVPSRLKIAQVIPIFKNGDCHDSCNYRPISVLPVFSKILERNMHKRLYNFISRFNILDNCQFGFRPNRSSYMAILKVYNIISNDLDNKKHTLGIFLDLSKAFDTINHDILLSKLTHYCIRGNAFDWFRSYLTDRSQCVSYNRCNSSFSNICRGVPQGSILGPLLFIIYMNDITMSSRFFSYILFADDTNLLASDSNLTRLINTSNGELAKVSTWLKANKLSLNIKKTTYMLF